MQSANVWGTTHVTLTARGPAINFDLTHDWKRRAHNWPLNSKDTKDGLIGRWIMDVQLQGLAVGPGQEGMHTEQKTHCHYKVKTLFNQTGMNPKTSSFIFRLIIKAPLIVR